MFRKLFALFLCCVIFAERPLLASSRSQDRQNFKYQDSDPLFISFSSIPGAQEINNPIFVTITANDQNFNGRIYLSSASGAVDPQYVDLTHGLANANATIYELGINNQLFMRWDPFSGEQSDAGFNASNIFNVTLPDGSLSGDAYLMGNVTDIRGGFILNATVQLYNGDPRSKGYPITDPVCVAQNGYRIGGSIPGQLYVQVSASGYYSSTALVGLGSNRTMTKDLFLRPIDLPGLKGVENIPVLLVPGIMGSSTSGFFYPHLPFSSPQWDSEILKIFSPDITGFSGLMDELILKYQRDVFEVPYDWTLSISRIRDAYLIPWIEKAKFETGARQVDIVAHSMGGLVVRSYIQSEKYANDVRRLAMVCTPNKGSAKVYYLWEGGNPKMADEVVSDDVWWLPGHFYTNTLNYLIKSRRNKEDVCKWKPFPQQLTPEKCDKDYIYEFLHDAVQSAGQLMPIYNNPLEKKGQPVQIVYEENTFLKALNNQSCFNLKGCVDKNGEEYRFVDPRERLGAEGSAVKTKLFIGWTHPTVERLALKNKKGGDHLNKDGEPESKQITPPFGDGTVWDDAVRLYYLLPEKEKPSTHAEGVKIFTKSIVKFLTKNQGHGFEVFEDTTSTSNNNITNTLVIAIIGRIEPKIVNAHGQKETRQLDYASLVEEDPRDGVYRIALQSMFQEAYELNIFFSSTSNQTNTTGARVMGFYDNTLTGFDLTINRTSERPIVFDRVFLTPTDLQMSKIAGNVELNWQDAAGEEKQDVSYYQVFSQKDGCLYYELRGRTSGDETTFDTNDLWNNSMMTCYRVRAILNSGKSTFFSNVEFLIPPESGNAVSYSKTFTQTFPFPSSPLSPTPASTHTGEIVGAILGSIAAASAIIYFIHYGKKHGWFARKIGESQRLIQEQN